MSVTRIICYGGCGFPQAWCACESQKDVVMTNHDEVKLFWLEPSNKAERYMRRYAGAREGTPLCPGVRKYHNARVGLGVGTAVFAEDRRTIASLPDLPKADKRWPTKCDDCDYVFTADDHYQHGQNLLYKRSDTRMLVAIEDAPVGAMWDAWWYSDSHKAPDGICLVMKTPGGEWIVDGQASNCKARDVKHQCWPRTGDPKNPQGSPPLNVAGNGGCKVGAGSIKMEKYHGFLNKGYLRTKRR